jgi:hypothetical protein
MVFNHDSQALVLGIEGWAFRDGPTLECTSGLQPEVIVKPAGGVLLNDESELTTATSAGSPGFGSLRELALGTVLLKAHVTIETKLSRSRLAPFPLS